MVNPGDRKTTMKPESFFIFGLLDINFYKLQTTTARRRRGVFRTFAYTCYVLLGLLRNLIRRSRNEHGDTSLRANFATGNPAFVIDIPSCPVLHRELLQIAGGNGSQQHLDNATPNDQPPTPEGWQSL